MRSALSAATVAALLLPACVPAVKRQLFEEELREAGFSEAQAQCLSEAIVPHLSVGELRELGRYVGTLRTSLRALPAPEALSRIVAEADPRILSVVVRAGATCMATLLAPPQRARG